MSIEEEAKNKQSLEVPNGQAAETTPLPEKPKRRRRAALRPDPTAEKNTGKAEEVTPKTIDSKPKRSRKPRNHGKSEDPKKEDNTKTKKDAEVSEALLLRFRFPVIFSCPS